MVDERLTGTLQENVITLLAHSDEHGMIVANLVQPELFEGEYRVIAERAIDYWKRYGKAPKMHTSDLVADILEDKHDRRGRTFRNTLRAMMELSENLNAQYIMNQLTTFVRMQRMKDAVLKSAERLNAQQETAVADIEKIWDDMLRAREMTFDKGTRLRDVDKLLNYLDTRQQSEFLTGIKELDRNYITPMRGAVMLLLGPSGIGKTWWLIHLVKQAILQRKKVMHISLEMDEQEVQLRLYQALFAMPKRNRPVSVTTLLRKRGGKLDGFGEEKIPYEQAFDDPKIGKTLRALVEGTKSKGPAPTWGTRFGNVLIKRFPPRQLTVQQLTSFMDMVEVTEKFIPDILAIDYPGIMYTDPKNHRIAMGRLYEEIRAIAVMRNIAVVAVHQTSRESSNAQWVTQKHIAEDWSMVATSDMILTFSATDVEHAHGLGRLFVSKARTEKDKFGILITQNYPMGQFVTDSAALENKYFELLPGLKDDSLASEMEEGSLEDDDDMS